MNAMDGDRVALASNPYNLIITGVGGQGNVLASRILGNMLSAVGFNITIGETFGASQRGGSVMSHLRISTEGGLSPQIAGGQAHMIVSLEPTEAIRVLSQYGNPSVKILTNIRPVYAAGVISGEMEYPKFNDMERWINQLSARAWLINSTEAALENLDNPIFSNIILIGALAKTGELPLSRETFEDTISSTMSEDKIRDNLAAYDLGMTLI